ncbi:Sugar phosphate isomerase/epimerase [Desulfonatronum thiosulfatophilum]|uniref:Sugar phosphate isomerase/epimerase n=1 Tax=Desulfonatronum thiosulfatophilum TaxID=617002 RepID=A0A1G6B9B7_9BACT|nr:cobamide remodeling phosphodiesterase CbiR [Desulfonatronum thiosulfatophilum]SDB17159.1 Sugar phosphate isomerase/epimerase [Desulfonatronum thiosulfatophilum]
MRAIIAAPSFVWPEHIAGNCLRLCEHVDEVGLLFLESQTCLAYTDHDLPKFLGETGLRFHVHLPLDLPWCEGPERVWQVIWGLQKKAAFLNPWGVVLHPPSMVGIRSLQEEVIDPLASVADQWLQSGAQAESLLLENTRENDLIALWPLIQALKLGICLDLGHLLAYGQGMHNIPGVWPHVRMVHLSAPGPHGEHFSLRKLDDRGFALMQEILRQIDPGCVLMVEVFDPKDFLESLHILLALIGSENDHPDSRR